MSKFRSPFNSDVKCTAGYPTYPSGGAHSGEDYVSVNKSIEESWKLVAVSDGKVYISKKQTGSYKGGYGAYGNYLVIQCDNGYWVLYAHMKEVPCVKSGSRVSAGQVVGYAGETGNANGRHLHIEVSDMRNVSYDGSTWYTKFVNHRVKPSDYIDFNNHGSTPAPEEGFEVKAWKNGSTPEPVYQTVADCKNKNNKIGSLDPRECASCYGIENGCYIVAYNAGNTRKVGFVAYHGGVK